MGKYKCAGITRRLCDYEDDVGWPGKHCPGCGRYYGIRQHIIGPDGGLATMAMSDRPDMRVKRLSSGVPGFDYVIGGGLVESQTILFGGIPGSRKTSLAIMIADGITRDTHRTALFASGEQNVTGVMQIGQLVGVKSDRVKVFGNASSVEDIIAVCDIIKPILAVFDSLQAISKHSSVVTEDITQSIVNYCKRTKMIGIIISQLAKDWSFKGGTGSSHAVDTLVVSEPFVRPDDGEPAKLFCQDVIDEIGYDRDQSDGAVNNLHILIGGVDAKNRYGAPNLKAYYYTTKTGALIQTEKQAPPPPATRRLRVSRR